MVFNKLIGTLLNLNYKINKCWSYLSKMDSPPLHTLFISIIYCFFYVPGYIKSEKAMATHSSTLAWRIPWLGESGRLQSMGSLRVRHDLSDFTFTFHFHALKKEMATHSSVLAWRIPGTGEPGGLPSMGSQSRTRLKWLSSSKALLISPCFLFCCLIPH